MLMVVNINKINILEKISYSSLIRLSIVSMLNDKKSQSCIVQYSVRVRKKLNLVLNE